MSSSAKADDPVRSAVPISLEHLGILDARRSLSSGGARADPLAGMTVRCRGDPVYLNAEKRLSNELAGTIGAAPATTPSFAGAANAAAACDSETAGFSGGWAVACLVSATFGAAATAFGADASERGGSLRLASMIFGFAGIGCALAVVSAEPPRPTLRARLLKNPSDCGAADATRVAGA